MQFHELRLTSLTAPAGGSFSALSQKAEDESKGPEALVHSAAIGAGVGRKKGILERHNQLTGFRGCGPDSLGRAACKALQVRSMVM